MAIGDPAATIRETKARTGRAKVTVKDLKGKVDPDWCPGCGDFGVLAALKQAIAELGLQPHEVLTVSGIGCSSNLPGYLSAYGMHTLHGRALAVAAGAQLANHELKIVVTGGDVEIAGKRVNDKHPKDRNIAMVFQNYALYAHMTVKDNMSFSLVLARRPQSEIDEKTGWAAKILNLEPYLKRYPRELSGGQRQRVAMGRAIVRDPQVFLFDEPLSNLDAKLRVQMRTEIKELHQRLKTTSIYVTHDQIEAMTMADQIVVMHDGRIEQIGSPLDLYDHPANRFVAGFLGVSNLLATTPAGTADGYALGKLSDDSLVRVPLALTEGLDAFEATRAML